MIQQSHQFFAGLSEVLSLVNQSDSFTDAFPVVEQAILRLFQAQRVTVYQRNLESREIVSRFKTGNEISEIRVPISTTSIAGYVAFSRKPLLIADVRDAQALRRLHPNLCFNQEFESSTGFRSKAMIVVSIEHNGVLLGVLQIINRQDGTAFVDDDLQKAVMFAQRLGQKFRSDFGCTEGPFEYLILQGQLQPAELTRLKEKAGSHTPVSRLLRTEMKLAPAAIGASLERFYQVPFLPYEPARYQLHPVCREIKPAYLRSNQLALLSDLGVGDEEQVLVLMDDPNDISKVLAVEHLLGTRRAQICVALLDDINRYLGAHGGSAYVDALTAAPKEIELIEAQPGSNLDGELLEEGADVVQLVNSMLVDARRQRASDIHIEPGKERTPTRVRMRIDGVCQEVMEIPAHEVRSVIARLKIMANMDIAERRVPQDGKFSVRIQGQSLDLRVATIPTVHGEGVVLRLLQSGEPVPFDQLNLSRANQAALEQLLKQPHGLILVVGPTGSGKTTTLHALLSQLNTPDKKIWTAEDPVEITQPGLQQVQVKPRIGFDFAAALRAFLRADPDVILIGEMRDRETAKAAIEASLTGHLVLSTLHTNSAPETVTRLLGLDIDPVNFSDALLGVLAQRLVRTLCAHCRAPYQPAEEELAFLRRHGAHESRIEAGRIRLHRARGCAACNQSGYRGRTGVHELLLTDDRLRDLIYHNADVGQIRQQAISSGMRTLMQDGIDKILQGQIDLYQLRRVVAE